VRYAVAVFLSSGLLFLIEPMVGKRVLPLLGGTAAVWTACLVFFQIALLVGYLGAHWLVTRATPRRQAAIYVALLVLSIVQLALSVKTNLGASSAHPVASVLWLLTMWIGFPFVTLSITSPLLQSWWARSNSATDTKSRTYRLYAISNVGSLLALLVYPSLLEPRFTLHDQAMAVVAGFVLLALVAGAIAYSARAIAVRETMATPTAPISRGDVALWVSLAACGSLLLSAVTSHLSQNVATLPLLWVIPLIAYLLSFVVGFSGERWTPRVVVLTLVIVALSGAGYLLSDGSLYLAIPWTVAAFCVALFLLCLFCHSELYRRRPPPDRLTVFYTCIAAGGALGASLVGIVAPMILSGNYELAFGLWLTAFLALMVTWRADLFIRALWITACVFTAILVGWQVWVDHTRAIVRVRNFYGTLQVTERRDGQVVERTLLNGVIQHGKQIFTTDMRRQPTTYYGHMSGVGLAIDLCCGGAPRRIGVIGLGTGTLAAYGRPGDVIRFYDINSAVEPIARNRFGYLTDSRARIEVVPGDARVSLTREAPQLYDVLAIDAFTGDAIPVHLITSEALEVYRRHLRPGGIVAFHVSNRYLELAPVVEQIAKHAGLETALITNGVDTTVHLYSADWVLVTDNADFLSEPGIVDGREKITVPPRLRRWTDDYNSLLPIVHWKGSAP